MAVDNGVNTGGGRIEVETINVMQSKQHGFVDTNEICHRQFICPGTPVHVSSHRCDRGHFFQHVEDFRRIDVAGMDNQIDTF